MRGISSLVLATLKRVWRGGDITARHSRNRHCEERSDEAIQSVFTALDCFACARNDGEETVACCRDTRMIANEPGEEFKQQREQQMSEAKSPRAGWQPAAYYPDPAIRALDPRFEKYWLKLSAVERLATGLRWAEGPVWFGDGRYLLCSDIPNQRILKWEEETGVTSIYRKPSNFANGNTRDRQGRLVTCEHGGRRVVRTEYDGPITGLVDSFDGKRLNSPNDVVVKSDGSIWFTDPVFGLLGNYEGYKGESEIDPNVYRIDGKTGKATIVAEGVLGPNGLCFSPDQKILYVVESRGVPNRKILAYDLAPSGDKISNKRLFIDAGPGTPYGMRCDIDGKLG